MSEAIVVGFGGNIGTPLEIAERFADARLELLALGELTAAALYRSAPIGPEQADYYNTAVRLALSQPVEPAELLERLHAIERSLGRRRKNEARFHPRAIDLDILVWGARQIRTPALEVPHPRLAERRFALEPLVAVVGREFEIPAAGRAGDLLAAVQDQRVELVGAW